MKIRTIYFKIYDMPAAVRFWATLLQLQPHKHTPQWAEFWCGNVRLGLLLNDFGDVVQGAGCVPVFEFTDDVLPDYLHRAKILGAQVVMDGLNDPQLRSIVFRCPFGHEFELSKFHDDAMNQTNYEKPVIDA